MPSRHRVNVALFAAVLAVPLASTAFGQYAVDRSGARDANPQVGSGGRNVASNTPRPWETANAIVEGTITGGKSFRGGTQSFDPRAFRGQTAGVPSANLVRDSSGITASGVASYNANRTYNFFGDNLAVNPPAGYQPIGSTGAYVPPRPPTGQEIDPRVSAAISDAPGSLPNRIGDSKLPGPIELGQFDPLAGTIGVDDPRLDPLSSLSGSAYTNLNRNGQYDLRTLQRIGSEVRTGQPGNQPGALGTGGPPAPGAGRDDSVDNSVNNAAANDPLTNTLNGPDGPVRPGALVAPEEQSSTYETLVKRRRTRDSAAGGGVLTLPGSEELNDPSRTPKPTPAKTKGEDSPVPGDTGPGADPTKPDNTKPDGGPQQGEKPPAAPTVDPNLPVETGPALPTPSKTGEPVKVSSFATGVKSKGLADLLTTAEKQLRDGQYVAAINTYDSAERAVPNNPLIKLGRAHAELGASYYMRADRTLRQTIGRDPNLLEGQYDLRTFLGEDRLAFLDKELKELVRTDEKNGAAAFLLAYVYYNTGGEARAQGYLALAEQRTPNDAFLKQVRAAWFPAASAEQNK